MGKLGQILAVLISVFTLTWTSVFASVENSAEVDTAIAHVLSASTHSEFLSAITGLAELDNEAAAIGYAKLLVERADFRNKQVTALVSLVYRFTPSNEISQALRPALLQVLERSDDDSIRLYTLGALARYGKKDAFAELVREYDDQERNSLFLGRRSLIRDVACKVSSQESAQFVVERVRDNADPVAKLRAEQCLRESNQPEALTIMREWNSVETGDFDLIVADHYLHTIALFGDDADLDFVYWVRENGEQLFSATAWSNRIEPLASASQLAIEQRSGNQKSEENNWKMYAFVSLMFLMFLSVMIFWRRNSPDGC